MASEQISMMSVREYLELAERNPDSRYEYLDGYAYMMSGGSADHVTISGNIHTTLRGLLRGGACRAYNSDMKVRVSEKRYLHPDVTVTCDARDHGKSDLIRSPRLVVEVLSPSTEARDRGRKLQCYLACPTIEEYLLVDSRSVRIEVYRKEQKKWVYYAYEAGDEVELTSLGVSFSVMDAYEDVVFEQEENSL
jgi:Uma2 family endonuclease